MNKKGFTLIELLAVIVILAIIALITTPIVLNLINQSKEAANKRSVEAYAKAVEYAVAQYEYEHNGELPTFDDIKNNIEYSNSDVKCHVAINCDTKGSVELTGCQVGSYTNNYYKYSSLKGNKGATVDEGVTEGPGNSSVEAACSGGSGGSSSVSYMYYSAKIKNPILNLDDATSSYGDNECPGGYVYEDGTCYYNSENCDDGFNYDNESGKCKGYDYYTSRPNDYKAYLKYVLNSDALVTPPEACIYSDTYGGELCLAYDDYANNVTKIKTYFNINDSEIVNGHYSKDGVSCIFGSGNSYSYCNDDSVCAFAFADGYADARDSSHGLNCNVDAADNFYCEW